MRHLLAATCLTPVAAMLAVQPAVAETVIGTARTTAIATGTAAGSTRDDVRIAAAGSITVGSGAAVTINSANSVKNEGKIQIAGANDSAGILAEAGTAGTIVNGGTISIDESYAPVDADKDGDLDGPFAQGARRYGIRIAPGGTFTGSLTHAGVITVEGNDSAGIALDSRLAGSVASTGKIDVVGNGSSGLRAGEVTGDVRIGGGSITAQGQGATGVALDGNVSGAVVVQGTIAATGYRSTAAPADVSKLDADDLLQGGSALRIAGNVGGGILFAAPPKDANPQDPDEDKDGIPDATESTASITSSGSAAAVAIGAAGRDIAIGPVAGAAAGGLGLVVDGVVRGQGVYKDVSATGIAIGGQGGKVDMAGGISVGGTVVAVSNLGNATALRIGDKASVPEIRVSGTVVASGGNSASSAVEAVSIDAGASVTALRNSGAIRAQRDGLDGVAVAVVDRSGTLNLIENAGIIAASGAAGDKAIAIDLRQNAAGATVRQLAAAQGASAGAIFGNVLFGAGNDVFEIADGSVAGAIRFGAGNNRLALSGDAVHSGDVSFGAGADTLTLAGTSRLVGNADFGGGADIMSLAGTSSFRGALSGSAGLAVSVGGGSLDLANKGAVALSSLSLGTGASMTVNVDGAAKTNTLYQVAGQANFGQNTKVLVNLANVSSSEGRYVIVKAGTLAGASNLSSSIGDVPFLFASSVATTANAGEVALDIRRKTAAELGLSRSQASAYSAVFSALDKDKKVADVFLGMEDGKTFRAGMQQLLPDHAGGTFENVTSGSRATARFLADPGSPMADMGRWGFWLQQVAWGTSKGVGDTASYDISGWGFAGGAEIKAGGAGNFGLSLGYLAGKDADGGNDNEVGANQYEAAAYWRGEWNGMRAFARASAARIGFDGQRHFAGTTAGGEAIARTAEGDWDGTLVSAAGGFSYEARMGRVTLRPAASVDYYRLKEEGYAETGGGAAFNLIVSKRTSDELAADATLSVGYDLGSLKPDEGWFRVELEGGRRQILGGELGDTVARFGTGPAFTLEPEDRTNGWVGRVRLLGGNEDFRIGGEFAAEEQQGRAALAGRASLLVGF